MDGERKGGDGKYRESMSAIFNSTFKKVHLTIEFQRNTIKKVMPLTSYHSQFENFVKRAEGEVGVEQAASFVTSVHCAETAIEKWGCKPFPSSPKKGSLLHYPLLSE